MCHLKRYTHGHVGPEVSLTAFTIAVVTIMRVETIITIKVYCDMSDDNGSNTDNRAITAIIVIGGGRVGGGGRGDNRANQSRVPRLLSQVSADLDSLPRDIAK